MRKYYSLKELLSGGGEVVKTKLKPAGIRMGAEQRVHTANQGDQKTARNSKLTDPPPPNHMEIG